MSRVAAIGLALTAIAVLAAGCGSSGSVSSNAKDTAPGASASIAQTYAAAYAHAVNLRASDVTGLVSSSRPEGVTKNDPFAGEAAECARGVLHVGEVLGVVSREFHGSMERRQGSLSILSLLPIKRAGSAVYMMESASIAARDVAGTHSARSRACMKRTFEGGILENGEPFFSHIEVSTLPSPWRPVQIFGQRVTASLAIAEAFKKGRTPYYEDFFAFTVGPNVITLNTTGDPYPFPPAAERRLLALLYRRAEAHPLQVPPTAHS